MVSITMGLIAVKHHLAALVLGSTGPKNGG